jgi:TPR repeat protein
MFEEGDGRPQDFSQAFTWYRKAAEQGNAEGEERVGSFYYLGRGVNQDTGEAAVWYRRAAEHGNPDAQRKLGGMYEGDVRLPGLPQDIETNVRQNYSEAARWLRRAADQGDPLAQLSLGLLYEEGTGVPQDFVQAHMWFNLAAASNAGYAISKGGTEGLLAANAAVAKDERNKVAASMTPEQIARAQELASRWHAVLEAK